MKVALCLSGHTRSYKKTYKYLYDNVLNKYDVDVFISTWIGSGFIKNFSFAYLHLPEQLGVKNEIGINKNPGIDEDIDVDHLKKIYNPKDIVIETPTDPHICEIRERFSGKYDKSRAACDSFALCFYKINNCGMLRKKYEKDHNIKYDVIIRGRFDFATTGLDLNTDMNLMHVKVTDGGYGITETVYFTNPEIMNKIDDTYTILTPEYLSSIVNGDRILMDRFNSLGIPYHNCLHFSHYFVKPPHVIDHDSRRTVCLYDELQENPIYI